MKSMTGYGKGTVNGDDFSVSVDLKTVNNRFLDIHLRVGAELSALESSIKRRITSRLSRGRVDVTVSLERTAQVAYELNRPLIAGYVSALKEMQQEFEIGGELDINVLARIPGALQPARNGIDERMIAALDEAIDQALDELEKMRQQEGEALRKELRDRLHKIEGLVPTIENAAAGLADAYRLRLQKRIGELLNRGGQVVEIDPAMLGRDIGRTLQWRGRATPPHRDDRDQVVNIYLSVSVDIAGLQRRRLIADRQHRAIDRSVVSGISEGREHNQSRLLTNQRATSVPTTAIHQRHLDQQRICIHGYVGEADSRIVAAVDRQHLWPALHRRTVEVDHHWPRSQGNGHVKIQLNSIASAPQPFDHSVLPSGRRHACVHTIDKHSRVLRPRRDSQFQRERNRRGGIQRD